MASYVKRDKYKYNSEGWKNDAKDFNEEIINNITAIVMNEKADPEIRLNALNSLNDGGWIAFHDFLPRDWKEQHVPMVQGTWTGDVWKLAFELIQSKDIDFKILEIDYGVCVMRPVATNAKIVDLSDELSFRQFDYLHKNIEKLPICSWEDGVKWILSS